MHVLVFQTLGPCVIIGSNRLQQKYACDLVLSVTCIPDVLQFDESLRCIPSIPAKSSAVLQSYFFYRKPRYKLHFAVRYIYIHWGIKTCMSSSSNLLIHINSMCYSMYVRMIFTIDSPVLESILGWPKRYFDKTVVHATGGDACYIDVVSTCLARDLAQASRRLPIYGVPWVEVSVGMEHYIGCGRALLREHSQHDYLLFQTSRNHLISCLNSY